MDLVEELRSFVCINSVYPCEQEFAHHVIGLLEEIGFSLEIVLTDSNRPNVVATTGTASSYPALYGHFDTVAPDPAFLVNPFELRVEGEKAFGLGAADMKGGVLAILEAGKHAVAKNLPLKIIFGVDEENISQGAHDLCASDLLDDVGFIIAAEGGEVAPGSEPVSVCIGRKGRIVVDVHVRGKAVHAADSNLGKNAISEASRLILALEKLAFEPHQALGSTEILVQGIEGRSLGLSVPAECLVSCTVMTSPREMSEDVLQSITACVELLGIDATVALSPRATPYGESFEISKDTGFLKELCQAVLDPRGVIPGYGRSVADENVFVQQRGIPTIAIGPDGGAFHSKDEWINLKSLKSLPGIYLDIVSLYHSYSR